MNAEAVDTRILELVRCPDCGGRLASEGAATRLVCASAHSFPVVRGIPRLLPSAGHDARTSESFGVEWEYHHVGDRTWGWAPDERVRKLFVEPIRTPVDQLPGKLLLDAGCGNGSQSVAYGALGLEVLALDVSVGLERGQALLADQDAAVRARVHFVQADLQEPPVPPESVDFVHSFGVLHHTRNTEQTFRTLCRTLRPGGTFYLWVHKREPITPLFNAARAVTTRVPPRVFARIAEWAALPVIALRWLLDRFGLRDCPSFNRREAALSIIDRFATPYSHHHTYAEVERWFRSEGFVDVWGANDDRRGFAVIGRKATP